MDVSTFDTFGAQRLTSGPELLYALLEGGQFPAGSMAPKIEAAIDFLERSRRPSAQVLITSCEKLGEALAGQTGTRVTSA